MSFDDFKSGHDTGLYRIYVFCAPIEKKKREKKNFVFTRECDTSLFNRVTVMRVRSSLTSAMLVRDHLDIDSNLLDYISFVID